MTAPGRPSGSAHAMLLSAKGYSCDAIADILSAHRTTVSLWIDAWHAKGLAGLRDEPRPGRPPIYSAAERARLQALVDEQPHQLKAAQARLEAETGKTASPRTVKRCLKKSGYSFKRARLSLADRRDESAFRHMAAVLAALENAEARGELTLHYFDESGFSQRSALPYAWSPVGRLVRLPAFSHSRRLNVLGFLSRHEGFCYHATDGRITSDTVITAFEQWLGDQPRDKPAIVVMDNAAIHHSARLRQHLEQWQAQRVFVLFLPPYSPELNRIEGLWRKIKYVSLPLQAYQSFESLCREVRTALDRCASSCQAICA